MLCAAGAVNSEGDRPGGAPDLASLRLAASKATATARTPSVQADGWRGSHRDGAISDRSATGAGPSYGATESDNGTDGAGWVMYYLTGSVCDRSHHSRCRDMGAAQRCIDVETGRADASAGSELRELHIWNQYLIRSQDMLGCGLPLKILSVTGIPAAIAECRTCTNRASAAQPREAKILRRIGPAASILTRRRKLRAC